MKRRNRHQRILELLQSAELGIDGLANTLDVSVATIRRDLSQLAEEGKITRTYGGAVLPPARVERSLQERATIAGQEKEAIAQIAVTHVENGDTLVLDAGTTTGALARQLRRFRDLKVITNGFSVMLALAEAEDIEVILLGGTLRYVSYDVVGPYAELVLRRITARKTFVSADGVVAGRGLCETTAEQASLKALMLEQSDTIYILADSTKLGDSYSSFWTPFPEKWTLITDSGATESQLASFRALPGVTIQVASSPAARPEMINDKLRS
jgi:DeoR family transcriptional regulator, fructose operon transcriptional repressor